MGVKVSPRSRADDQLRAASIAERAAARDGAPVLQHNRPVRQFVGIFAEGGEVRCQQRSDFSDALLHAADVALYRAKREGRDRVVVSESLPPAPPSSPHSVPAPE